MNTTDQEIADKKAAESRVAAEAAAKTDAAPAKTETVETKKA